MQAAAAAERRTDCDHSGIGRAGGNRKLADRVGVMFAGQILGEFPVSEMDTEKIGALMAGITEAEVRVHEAGNGKTSGTQSADALAGAGGGSFRRSGFLRYLFCSDGARSF
ncbi:MAG: hypothetical protein ACLR2G_00155 [Phascolarctobacterium faecium]